MGLFNCSRKDCNCCLMVKLLGIPPNTQQGNKKRNQEKKNLSRNNSNHREIPRLGRSEKELNNLDTEINDLRLKNTHKNLINLWKRTHLSKTFPCILMCSHENYCKLLSF